MTKMKIHLNREYICQTYLESGIDGVMSLLKYEIIYGDDDLLRKLLRENNKIKIEQIIIESLTINK